MKLVDALAIGAAATQIRWLGQAQRMAHSTDPLCPAVSDYLARLQAAYEVLQAEHERVLRLDPDASDLLVNGLSERPAGTMPDSQSVQDATDVRDD